MTDLALPPAALPVFPAAPAGMSTSVTAGVAMAGELVAHVLAELPLSPRRRVLQDRQFALAARPVGADVPGERGRRRGLWRDRPPGEEEPEIARDYETVGFVISGRAELRSEGQTVLLEPGNSWVVPRGAVHTDKILEAFTAVEATHPPAEVHDRDRPASR